MIPNQEMSSIGPHIENLRDLLLRDCAKGREKETQIHHSHYFLWERTYCPTNKTSVTS